MTRKELLELAEKSRIDAELYYRPGLDDVSRTFLHNIKLNPRHQERKSKFEEYSGYKSRY